MPALRNCSRTVMDRTLASSSRISDSRFSGRSTYAASTGGASGPGYGPGRGRSAMRVSRKQEDDHQAGWKKFAEECGAEEVSGTFYRNKPETAQPAKRPPLADIKIDTDEDRTSRQGIIGAYAGGPALAVRGDERDEAADLEVMQQDQMTYQPQAGVRDSQSSVEVGPYARVGRRSPFQDGAIRGRTIYSSRLEPPFTYNAAAQTHRGYHYASRDAVEETSTHSATHPIDDAIAFPTTYGAGLAGNPSYEQPDNDLVPMQHGITTHHVDDTSYKVLEGEGMGSAALGVSMAPQEERTLPDAYRHSEKANSSEDTIHTPTAMDRIAKSLFNDPYLNEDHHICWLDEWICTEIMRQLTPPPTGFDRLEDEATSTRDYEDEEEDASGDDNEMLYVIEEGDGVDFANDGGEDKVE